MVNECAHLLLNGKKCRCVATRGHALCRHHGARPTSTRKVPMQPRKERWRMMFFEIQELSLGQLPNAIDRVMTALCSEGYHGISDRTAGALLRVILYRIEKLSTKPVQPIPSPSEEMVFPEIMTKIAREQGLDEKSIQKLLNELVLD